MSAHIVVLPAAERDIEHALDWYLENAPEHAERFTADLSDTVERISVSPRLFHTVHGEVRRAALRRFPYLVWLVYFDSQNTVHILAVSHQRQDPETTRQRV